MSTVSIEEFLGQQEQTVSVEEFAPQNIDRLPQPQQAITPLPTVPPALVAQPPPTEASRSLLSSISEANRRLQDELKFGTFSAESFEHILEPLQGLEVKGTPSEQIATILTNFGKGAASVPIIPAQLVASFAEKPIETAAELSLFFPEMASNLLIAAQLNPIVQIGIFMGKQESIDELNRARQAVGRNPFFHLLGSIGLRGILKKGGAKIGAIEESVKKIAKDLPEAVKQRLPKIRPVSPEVAEPAQPPATPLETLKGMEAAITPEPFIDSVTGIKTAEQGAAVQGGIFKRIAVAPANVAAAVQRFHAENMMDRVTRVGGENAKLLADMAREATSEAHAVLGELAVRSLDDGLRAAGKPGKATKWLNTLEDAPGGQFGQVRLRRILEGKLPVPDFAKETFAKIEVANLDIGKVAETAVPGFKATGKMQRSPTPAHMDIIGRGRNAPEFERLVDAFEHYNPDVPREAIVKIMTDIKTRLDAGDWEGAYRTMQQEHVRVLPDVPSYISVGPGMRVPLYHDLAFDYLRNASQRTALRASFMKKFGAEGASELIQKAKGEMPSLEVRAVDDLIRTLHGIPIDQITTGRFGYAMRLANETVTSIFSPIALSASSIPNAIELIVGQTPRSAGYRNYLRGAFSLYKDGRSGLEALGSINMAIFDWSSNPYSKYRTGIRRFRNSAHIGSLNNILNELQESLAASTAQVVRQDMQSNLLSGKGQSRYIGLLEDFGFDRNASARMVKGKGTEAEYNRFVRRAAAIQTGGNRLPAEGSRLQNSRLASSLFKFQTYPIVAANQIAKPVQRMIKHHNAGEIKQRNLAIRDFGKQLGFTVASGAGIMFMKALLSGGEEGIGIKLSEARDELDEFLGDAFLNGIGGPASMVAWALRRSDKGGLGDTALSMTFPGSIAIELGMFLSGSGPYKIAESSLERGRIYFERTPLGRIASTWVGSIAYGDMSPADKAAISAYWRWKRDLKLPIFTNVGGEDQHQEFRNVMRRASNAIKSQNDEVVRESLIKAFNLGPEIKTSQERVNRIRSSLRGRMLLTKSALGAQTEVEYEERYRSLKQRLPAKSFERLFNHDQLLINWIEALK